MQRKALLIGHNDAAHNPLTGVNSDVDGIENFLLSDYGGAWHRQEILRLARPSSNDLRWFLDNEKSTRDYILIAFSGHGGHDPRYGSYVCLSDTENFLVEELTALGPQARRQTVIVDACRTVVPGVVIEGPIERIADVGGVPDMRYRQMCRVAYERAILRANEGTITLQACLPHELAMDTPWGGVFTQALLRYAWNWANAISNNFAVQQTYNVLGVFRYACDTVKRASRQKPSIRFQPGRETFFPFIVA